MITNIKIYKIKNKPKKLLMSSELKKLGWTYWIIKTYLGKHQAIVISVMPRAVIKTKVSNNAWLYSHIKLVHEKLRPLTKNKIKMPPLQDL